MQAVIKEIYQSQEKELSKIIFAINTPRINASQGKDHDYLKNYYLLKKIDIKRIVIILNNSLNKIQKSE